MDKPRRSSKKVNYIIDDGNSDDEDFMTIKTSSSQNKPTTEASKPSPKKRNPTKRLSRDEQKFQKDLELALQISNAEKTAQIPHKTETEASTSLVAPATKRSRKKVNFKEDDSDCWSDEDFKGWPAEWDDDSPSPKKKKQKTSSNKKKENKEITLSPQKNRHSNLEVQSPCMKNLPEPPRENDPDPIAQSSFTEAAADPPITVESPIRTSSNSPIRRSPSPILHQSKPYNSPIPSTVKSEVCKKTESKVIELKETKKQTTKNPIKSIHSPSPNRSTLVKTKFRSPLMENSYQESSPKPPAKIGLRLGLSRRGNIKPLHPNASSS